jgi:hypothetical protein
MKRISWTTALLILLVTSSAKAQQQAYIWDGNTMQPVTDTRDLACRKWSIWLFTLDDHAKVPGGQWGNIVGESESDVMAQLKKGQEDDDAVTRGSRNPQGDTWLSHRNYTGPICNVKPFNPDVNDALDQLESLSHRLDHAYSMLRKLLPDHASELEDQLKQLAETLQRVNKLRNDLVQRNRSGLMTINKEIEEATRRTQALETNSQQIAHRFGSGANLPAKPPASTSWSHQQVTVLGANISQSIQMNGGKIHVSQTVVNDPNGQGQAYSFSAQSLDSAATSVKAQGTLWVVSLRSTSRNVSMQITNGGGGVTNEVVSTIQLYFSSQAQAQAAATSFSQWAGH